MVWRNFFTSARRVLRKALAIFLLAVAAGLLVFWFRSYASADRLHGRAWGRQSFIVASKQGRLTFLWFTWHGAPNWWQWGMHTHPVDDELSFPAGDVRQYENAAGFGLVHNPIYFVMRSTYQAEDGTTVSVWGAATATLRGSGLIVPYWFPILATSLAGLPLIKKRPRQFGIRSLLLLMTLVAVVLGLAIILDR